MQKYKLLKSLVIENPKISKQKHIGYVYAFYNPIRNKIYIGKTVTDYRLRWADHKCNSFTKELKNYFYNSIRKYG